jgi:hypothetical protein
MTSASSLKATARSLAHCWQEFFHSPCDARVCAAIRIGYAALVLVHLAVLFPDLDHWFTDAGILPLEASRRVASPHAWSLLWLLPGTATVVNTCFWIAAAQAAMLLVGFLPRLNALCIFIWLVSLQQRNPLICDGEDVAMRMIAFFLIWMPLGNCWSLNSLLSRYWTGPRNAPLQNPQSAIHNPQFLAPAWPLRLLQLQMALIYLSAALEKLSGETWLNGTALYYVSRLDDYFGRFPVPTAIFDSPWIVALLTWSVVLVELAVPLLIWFRETRLPCVAAAILFHLANEWTMHLFLFHWIMIVGWLSFLTPDDFRWLYPSLRNREVT